MKKIIMVLFLIALSGCGKDECIPCTTKEGKPGFGFCFWCGLGLNTHCIDCEKAKSPEARYVCFGEKNEPTK